MLAGNWPGRKIALTGTSALEPGSEIVIRFITAAIPAGLLDGTNFMKRKNPLCEPEAEQNKNTRSRAFRTVSDFAIGKGRESLPEIATVGTEQSDINARDQCRWRIALSNYSVRRLPIGHCRLGSALGGA